MPVYRLTPAQVRTINDDRRCVQIAIPLPWIGVGNPERYARHWLAVPSVWVRSVSPATIAVEPAIGQQGLAAKLGKIVRDPCGRWRELVLRAEVLLVVLGPPGARIVGPIQWPGSVE